jgi:hypothetical protein
MLRTERRSSVEELLYLGEPLHHLYTEALFVMCLLFWFPAWLYAFTKLVLRLGVDGVVIKHKNPIIRNSAAILIIKYFTPHFTIHIGSITHTSPICPRSLYFAAHITGLVRLIYQYDVFLRRRDPHGSFLIYQHSSRLCSLRGIDLHTILAQLMTTW